MDSLTKRIEDILDDVREMRHDLHRHPELGYEEHRTAGKVLDFLKDLPDVRIEDGIAGTGISVLIGADQPGPCVGLRADMDALPMQETSGVPWASEVPDKMHACGHDGHTAMLAGAGRIISELRDQLPGPVKLLFQPAEEGGAGGKALCEAGVLDDPPVAAVFGLHNNLPSPTHKIGDIAYTSGPAMAGTQTFEITVNGRGGHAAFPHRCIDPIYTGACIIDQLQGIVSREVEPIQPAVVSVTQFKAGTTHNIIPESAVLSGTVRALDIAVLDSVCAAIERCAVNVAQARGATAECVFHGGYPVLVNDGRAEAVFREILRETGDIDRFTAVPPSLGGEDFAYFAQKVPSFFYFLTACPENMESIPMCHHPDYDFNDRLLPEGIRLHVETALRFGRLWQAAGT